MLESCYKRFLEHTEERISKISKVRILKSTRERNFLRPGLRKFFAPFKVFPSHYLTRKNSSPPFLSPPCPYLTRRVFSPCPWSRQRYPLNFNPFLTIPHTSLACLAPWNLKYRYLLISSSTITIATITNRNTIHDKTTTTQIHDQNVTEAIQLLLLRYSSKLILISSPISSRRHRPMTYLSVCLSAVTSENQSINQSIVQ